MPWPWLNTLLKALMLIAKSLPTIYAIVVAIKDILKMIDSYTQAKDVLDKLAKALTHFVKTGNKDKLENLLCELTKVCPTKKT